MAREFAQVRLDLWADPDVRKLSERAQRLYLFMLTHPDLNYAGVMDWRPARLAGYASDSTAQSIRVAADELEAAHFIVTDEDVEEALIRSFLRHDGLLKQPRVSVSMANAYGGVVSATIRGVIVHELRRLQAEHPEYAAWTRDSVQKILRHEAIDPKGLGVAQPSALGVALDVGLGQTQGKAQTLPTPAPATSPATSPKGDKEAKASSSSETADAPSRPDVDSLLDLLDQCIESNGAKKPARTKKNRDAGRLLLDRDGYTQEQVAWMIRWATADEFWRVNILSMSKLREKFNQLRAKAVGGKPRTAPVGFHGDIDVDAVLGRDVWSPGTPPEGLDVAGEIEWKKAQRVVHNAERLAEAKRKLGLE